jgi:hypothetical protein
MRWKIRCLYPVTRVQDIENKRGKPPGSFLSLRKFYSQPVQGLARIWFLRPFQIFSLQFDPKEVKTLVPDSVHLISAVIWNTSWPAKNQPLLGFNGSTVLVTDSNQIVNIKQAPYYQVIPFLKIIT